LFELLDVVAIAPRVDLPVDGGEIIAVDVLTVFGELDAEALERAAVQAGEKPFDDRARPQLEAAETCEDRRVEELPLARRLQHEIQNLQLGIRNSCTLSLRVVANVPGP